jgi:CheY-like chemotaxis protein
LVANAISYTRDGTVVVGCRRAGPNVRIEVWDSGVGVAEDELQTIFEDYYQVDNPARDRRKGLGLGLAIAQRIAKLLDHEILVRSQLGEGSVFAIQVPRAAGMVARTVSAPAERRPRSSFVGRALVAIEDDASILQGLERLLTTWGAEAFACSTVDEALVQLSLSERKPDLVIADYRLSGGLNGIQAVEKIRTSFGEAVPAIVVTGDTSAGVTESIRASGCRLAHKPLEPQVLRRLIDEALSATENGPIEKATRGPIDDPAETLERV